MEKQIKNILNETLPVEFWRDIKKVSLNGYKISSAPNAEEINNRFSFWMYLDGQTSEEKFLKGLESSLKVFLAYIKEKV